MKYATQILRQGLLFALLATALQAGTYTAVTTIGSLTAGADPFFWGGAPLAVGGLLPSGGVPAVCGANCASYTADTSNLLIDNSVLFPVTDPLVTVISNPGGADLLSLTGLINVAAYTVAYNLSVYLPIGTLDATDLTGPLTIPASLIDTSLSSFNYQIVAGGPPVGGTFTLQDGFAEVSADSAVPEPSSLLLGAAGFGAVAFARRRKAQV